MLCCVDATVAGCKALDMRRLVTGLDVHGRSSVVEETTLDSSDDGLRMQTFFTTSTNPPPLRPVGTGSYLDLGVSPGIVRGSYAKFLPGFESKMHHTDTIDFEYIISGEVWLDLDDGATVYLHAGDTVVQNGTRHRWRNEGAEPCRIVVFMVGTPRTPSGIDVARDSVLRS